MDKLLGLKKYGAKIEESIATVFEGQVDDYYNSVLFYANDDQIDLIEKYIEEEDYALMIDCVRSIMHLAYDLGLYEIYIKLTEMDYDLKVKEYKDLKTKYQDVVAEFQKFKAALGIKGA